MGAIAEVVGTGAAVVIVTVDVGVAAVADLEAAVTVVGVDTAVVAMAAAAVP